MDLNNKQIDSKRLAKEKSAFLIRSDDVKKSEAIGLELVRQATERNIKIQYDVVYGGHPHELRYTEYFGSLGGIYVTSCCGKLLTYMLQEEYDTSNNVDFSSYIKGRPDKYLLHHYDIEPMECSVLLPGSNLLKRSVIKQKLNGAADLGAKIKPHPLTNSSDLDRLKKEYGKLVLPSMYSGFNVMKASNYVFTTGASELGLYAMLLDKHVIDIANNEAVGGYYDIFKRTVKEPHQKEKLNYLLNHPGMGIIMPDNFETKIPYFLDFYQRKLKEFKK